MKGEVKRPTAKLFNYPFSLGQIALLMNRVKGRLTQLLLPPILTPLARMLKGKTSETIIHETGPATLALRHLSPSTHEQKSSPHEYAKLIIKIHTNTTAAHPAPGLFSKFPEYDPIIPATMKWHTAIPVPPAIRIVRRPTLSTQRTAGMVKTNSKMPAMPVARSEVVLWPRCRFSKTWGLVLLKMVYGVGVCNSRVIVDCW